LQYLELPKGDVVPKLRYAFVFDGMEALRNKAVLRFIERSICAPFPNITTILVSRCEPRINTMGFLSRNLMVRITEEELRFTWEEIADYFRIRDLSFSGEELEKIWEDTEGWPFAVHLASLMGKNQQVYTKAGRRLGSGYTRSSMKRIAFKLIDEEVFAGLTGELKTFLIKLSLTEHRSQELMEILAGSEKLVQALRDFSSFVSFNPFSPCYHIHRLFNEYLQRRQGELPEADKRDIWLKSARWCAENELPLDAIGYYEKTGEYGEILKLGFILPQTTPAAAAEAVLAVLNRAPRGIYDKFPQAHSLRCRMLLFAERSADAEREINRLIKTYSVLPPSPYNNQALFGAYMNQGLLLSRVCNVTGDYSFVQSFRKAYQLFKTGGISNVGYYSSHGLFITRVGAADTKSLENYLKAVEESSPWIAEMFNGSTQGVLECCREEIHYCRGELDSAEACAIEALRKSRETEQYEVEFRALVVLLMTFYAQGNTEACRSVLDQLKNTLHHKRFCNRHIFYDACAGIFYARMGLSCHMAPWTRDILGLSGVNAATRALEVHVKIRYLLAERRYQAVLGLLEQDNQGMNTYLFGRIIILLSRAICLYHLKNYKESMRALSEARTLAEPNGLDMLFIEEGKEMRTLVSFARKDPRCTIDRAWLDHIARQSSAYVKKTAPVIAAFGGKSGGASGQLLTLWEQELLSGLAQGLTRRELAHRHGLSLNTVKTMITNIYLKLDAPNLMKAVARARALHLLEN
jgi:LuxR family maltose regulon positive regulatory protein